MNNIAFRFSAAIVFTFILNFASSAQLIDSLRYAIKYGKPGFDFKFGGSNAIITDRKAPTLGIRSGVSLGNNFSFGIGYMYIPKGFSSVQLQNSVLPENIITRRLRLNYFCAYTQYFFYKTKRWDFSIIPQIGVGNTFYTISVNSAEEYSSSKTRIWLYEPMMTGAYRFLPWLGVGAELGFRFALKDRAVVTEVLTSPLYSFHIDIYWTRLARKYFPNNILVKRLL